MEVEQEIILDFGYCKVYCSQSHFMSLDPRERKVLELRLGLNGNKKHTLQKIAELIDNLVFPNRIVNRERVRQIQEKAKRKLFHPARHIKIVFNDDIDND